MKEEDEEYDFISKMNAEAAHTLKPLAAICSETSVTACQSTQHNIIEDNSFPAPLREPQIAHSNSNSLLTRHFPINGPICNVNARRIFKIFYPFEAHTPKCHTKLFFTLTNEM
jgi:hypothetical protein